MQKPNDQYPPQRKWIPLQAAIALVWTRDTAFAGDVASAPGSGRSINLDLVGRVTYRKIEGHPLTLHHKGVDEALRALLAFVADEEVAALGTAVDRYTEKGVNHLEFERLRGALDPAAAEELILRDRPDGETWLAPANATFLGGQGRYWRGVTINRRDLCKALGIGTGKLQRGNRAGRKPDYLTEHWELLKKQTFRILQEYGDPATPDAHHECRSVNMLIGKLQEYADARPAQFPKGAPSRPSMQPHVNDWLDEWRGRQAKK